MSAEALTKVCPRCNAPEGQRCVKTRGGDRKAFHRERGRRSSSRMVYSGPELPTDSPIEKSLVQIVCAWIEHHGVTASITTQVPIGPFRADALVETDGRKLVVECDGHAYHNSKEQVEKDKRRDRYFVARGYSVMRFTGSEITRDLRGCAAEIGLWINLA